MKAIILVGGLGTRLRPLTYSRHKSLMPVLNTPFMDHLLGWLEKSPVRDVVLAIGQHNEDLARAYPPGTYGSLNLTHSLETERLESGGAIRQAAASLSDTFIVLNGDIYTELDLECMLDRHKANRALVSLALCPVDEPWHFGVVETDENARITRFVEKPPRGTEQSNLINAGVWIFEPDAVRRINGPVRVEDTLFPELAAEAAPIFAFPFHEAWVDIGTPARYRELNLALAARRTSPAGVVCADGTAIAPDAQVGQSVLGRNTSVASGAKVQGSVLWDDVSIGRNATIRRSVLADGVQVGDGCTLDGVVLGPRESVPAGACIAGDL